MTPHERKERIYQQKRRVNELQQAKEQCAETMLLAALEGRKVRAAAAHARHEIHHYKQRQAIDQLITYYTLAGAYIPAADIELAGRMTGAYQALCNAIATKQKQGAR